MSASKSFDLIVIGGGAAGFYAAVHLAQAKPHSSVLILEQSQHYLSKVKVSGGGRCNVTNNTSDPKELIKNYPRGNKELLGPFYQHGPLDTIAFFESNGVNLKEEDNGRMFPVSNSSSSIVDLLMNLADQHQVQLKTSSVVQQIEKDGELWKLTTKNETYFTSKLLIASGSSKSIWKQLESLNIPIVAPVPSLFTFKLDSHPISQLSGLSAKVFVYVNFGKGESITASGPLLITHQGFSGPAVLECSAWGALKLNELNYQFDFEVNWLPDFSREELLEQLKDLKTNSGTKSIQNASAIKLPKRLWEYFLTTVGIDKSQQWAQMTKAQLNNLVNVLIASHFSIDGKSTFKEEFVSAGGVQLKSVNFKTMESKIHPGLYFAGEVLNIDAITGGYNFQNAWTTAYLASSAIAESL